MKQQQFFQFDMMYFISLCIVSFSSHQFYTENVLRIWNQSEWQLHLIHWKQKAWREGLSACSLVYCVLFLINLRLFFVIRHFSILNPWPASPEITIMSKILLFGNWTWCSRLSHQSVSFTFAHTKKANGSFFLSVHWGRKNIALQLTSNQIALDFHSLCPHSICTNHHRPTRISHPAWGILTSTPQ